LSCHSRTCRPYLRPARPRPQERCGASTRAPGAAGVTPSGSFHRR
jgi:hypothetical protein